MSSLQGKVLCKVTVISYIKKGVLCNTPKVVL
jgi:hypothetical protein